MNDSMTSVADIPSDADDDLSEITPELVLVDPELARLMRERQPDVEIVQSLRLVPAVDEEDPAIVPRPTPTSDVVPRRETDIAPPPMPTSPGERPPDELPAPVSNERERPLGTDPAPLIPAPRHVVDAEPARFIDAPVAPGPVPLLPEPTVAAVAPGPAAALASPPEAGAAMPHPIVRPERSRRPVRKGVGRPRRRRRVLAFIAAVAAASVATLGILNLTGDSSSSSSSAPTARAPISGGPTSATGRAAKRAKLRAKATPKPTVAAKPKAPAEPKPSATSKSTPEVTSGAPRSNAKPPVTQRSKPRPTPATPKSAPAAPATAARRFAWAPVAGAVSYHVELFKGADRVLAKETKQPILELGPTWRYEGKTVRLTPGTYRWYVWPVTKTGRAQQAVVVAKLPVR